MIMQVCEVMTRKVECIQPHVTLQAAAERMKALDVGSLPVCENDRLVGIVTDRDIAIRSVASGHDPLTERVRDVMTFKINYCYEDHDVDKAAEIMKEKQIRR